MKKINLTYEQIIDKLKGKGECWDGDTLTKTFGKEHVDYIKDVDEIFPLFHGMYVLSSLSGFVLFPLNEDGDILDEEIQKMDVDWAINMENVLKYYEEEQKVIARSINTMKTLIQSQRIKKMFE
jgi:hypothetical protein